MAIASTLGQFVARLHRRTAALFLLSVATVFLAVASPAQADPPLTVPRDLSGWQRSAFTVWLDCDAGTTVDDELYSVRYRMDWEPEFNEDFWNDEVVAGTFYVIYSFVPRAYNGVREFAFYSVGHNDTSGAYDEEAVQTMPVRIDTVAPLTTNDAPAGWRRGPVTVRFSASDPPPAGMSVETSGVKVTEFAIDGGAWEVGSEVTLRTWRRGGNTGAHTVAYRSTDNAGNVETQRTCTVSLDARPPITSDNAPLTPVPGPVIVTLTPTDVNSGVEATYWAVDALTFQKGTQATVSGVGPHWLFFYSVDNLGNVEQVRLRPVTIASPQPLQRPVAGGRSR